MKIEAQYPNDWKIALTVTEFLMAPFLRQNLHKIDTFPGSSPLQGRHMYAIPGYIISGNPGNDNSPVLESLTQLTGQRSVICGDVPEANKRLMNRYMHVGYKGGEYAYSPGRHGVENAGVDGDLPGPLQVGLCVSVSVSVCLYSPEKAWRGECRRRR